ncbi:MAG: GTP cyclohydrolase II, partial [Actinomycetota bacterium]|nr:GTP cyclohydrolase II [Actinomycetota bacterium]
VDLCRLAGLEEVAAIAELVHDDGRMMRLTAAGELARGDGLVLITIAQLVAWRREHADFPELASGPTGPSQPRVERTSEAALPTKHGELRVHGFRDLRTGASHAALVSQVAWQDAPLVRVHSECLTGDAFGSLRCDCGPQLDAALARIAREGGVVVYLRGHEGRGIGLLGKLDAYALQDDGRDTIDANLELGWPVDRREYGAAAAILRELGIDRVRLMTNNPAKVAGLQGDGVAVIETAPHEVGRGPENEGYLRTKAERMGHWLSGFGDADDATARSATDEPLQEETP